MARRANIPRSAIALACLVVENMAAIVIVEVLRVEEWRVVARGRGGVEVVSLEVERGVGESACCDWPELPAAKVAPSDRLDSVNFSINIRLQSVNKTLRHFFVITLWQYWPNPRQELYLCIYCSVEPPRPWMAEHLRLPA